MSREVQTEDKLEYTFFPVNSNSLFFKVKCANDAHIALTTGPGESEPMYEIFIGGWGNQKTAIRRNREKPDKSLADTPNVVTGDELRGFWVRWGNGSVAVGREGEQDPIVAWDDPEPFRITHYGICTGWGATGQWIIEEPAAASAPGWVQPRDAGAGGAAAWVDTTGGDVPANAVPGGMDVSGESLFVGRARHEGALLPGKVVPSHGCCYVPWGGAEHAKQEYQVLTGCDPVWMPCSGAGVPAGALPAGETEDGEALFIGRATHEGVLAIGKVQASHNVCYVPFAGQEVPYSEYEVLVANL
ncbi:uncharacterized protein LOC117649696 [Thrips palmi]|uniref:Uncharacterized protein LOC117649696 n=1 Tax=Thrips palmi TaxID=161013 RepID=A0A6P8ZTZ0_THRPL|nr:uncharacterized protein LOC117649696 [Thrips palmi]